MNPELRIWRGHRRKSPWACRKWGNVGHCNNGGNIVHTHNWFLYYPWRLLQRINDNCGLCKLHHQADNPKRLLQREAAAPRIRSSRCGRSLPLALSSNTRERGMAKLAASGDDIWFSGVTHTYTHRCGNYSVLQIPLWWAELEKTIVGADGGEACRVLKLQLCNSSSTYILQCANNNINNKNNNDNNNKNRNNNNNNNINNNTLSNISNLSHIGGFHCNKNMKLLPLKTCFFLFLKAFEENPKSFLLSVISPHSQ